MFLNKSVIDAIRTLQNLLRTSFDLIDSANDAATEIEYQKESAKLLEQHNNNLDIKRAISFSTQQQSKRVNNEPKQIASLKESHTLAITTESSTYYRNYYKAPSNVEDTIKDLENELNEALSTLSLCYENTVAVCRIEYAPASTSDKACIEQNYFDLKNEIDDKLLELGGICHAIRLQNCDNEQAVALTSKIAFVKDRLSEIEMIHRNVLRSNTNKQSLLSSQYNEYEKKAAFQFASYLQ
ncbi:hypothetical protein DASB73_029930 [Starmerella bacillaris]|uniref:Uncharacterized protein n=1 Tax=Starmerella bacillaris TaxID=1247836 RepID=A0AAV5RKF9_STABA|nr:hypothetical protein DASB73_029930 [Starmerella bacillaris]